MSRVKEISVFFPAFNEAANISSVVQKCLKVLEDIAQKYEVLVIDDGSSDNTTEVVKGLIKKDPHVKLLKHPKNLGYGAALKSGLYNANYDLVAFNDGDGQFDFGNISDFLHLLDKSDLVIGFRKKRSDPFFRIVNAKLYSFFLRMIFGLSVKDVDCGFKLIKRSVIEKIPKLQSDGALVSAELLIKAKKMGFKINQVGVDHYPRTAGNPTGANVKVIFKMFREVSKLYRILR